MTISIIGDIAGRFNELQSLLKKLPDGPIICVGDLMDRGPDSRKVIEWAMENESYVTCIYGNHEDMMIKACTNKNYDPWNWFINGGLSTIVSYGANINDFEDARFVEFAQLVPKEHLEWLTQRPRFFTNNEIIVTHAPICFDFDHIETIAHTPNFIWNRRLPSKNEKFQIYGHNSQIRLHGDKNNLWGICIDNSSESELCAFVWPEKRIERVLYEQPK